MYKRKDGGKKKYMEHDEGYENVGKHEKALTRQCLIKCGQNQMEYRDRNFIEDTDNAEVKKCKGGLWGSYTERA